ncbi:rCG61124 [Rattus norvegicus]|uniref:RCG61124 n=1 Tax=Rattus norvegicus TaxID=10116 RepID=A6KEJ7_RAT|nr:rCG61124 [Rattus norvegicus]
MNTSPVLVAVVLFMLGRTHGNSVIQTPGQMTLSENDFLFINCTYSTPFSSGMSSILEKVHSSFCKSEQLTTGESTEVLKLCMIKGTLPSTCRKPQCQSQNRLCTTLL